jgi:hypothetical protein
MADTSSLKESILAPKSWRQRWDGLREGLSRPGAAVPFSAFVGSRAALFVLVAFFIGFFPGDPEAKPGFLDAFASWDGQWYLDIVTNGYWWSGPQTQSNVVFFPLYPLLGKIVGTLVGDPRWGLFIVTHAALAAYLYYLYRIARRSLDAESSQRAVLYVVLFPIAFIFSCLYTEATSFAFSAAAFCYALEGRWKWALPLGFLAALSRLAGLAILLPLAYEYLRQNRWRPHWDFLGLAAVPAGTASFALYLWAVVGNPLAFMQTQEAWFRTFTWPWDTFAMGLERVGWPLGHYVTSIAIIDTASIALFTILTAIVLWKLPLSHGLYCLPVLWLSLSTTIDPAMAPPTGSIPRFLMALFPCFLALGMVARNRYLDLSIRWTFAVLGGIAAMYFFSNYWVV